MCHGYLSCGSVRYLPDATGRAAKRLDHSIADAFGSVRPRPGPYAGKYPGSFMFAEIKILAAVVQ
jgi:hypothetical protein